MHVAIVSPYDPRPAEGSDPRAIRGPLGSADPPSREWRRISERAILGGVEEALDRCARGLAARGHEVTLVCSATRAGESIDDDGVRVVRVKRRGSLFRAPLAPLWRHLPRDAEVIHVPATYPLVSDLVPLRESKRRPVVVDYHFDVHGTGLAMRVASAAYAGTLGRAMRRATRVVCKSHDYARHSRVLSRVPSGRLDWVPNGVDVRDFPLHLGPRQDILCVGRLVPYKGVDVLLRAMPRIHDLTGARLTIVGDGPEAARLRSLAARIGAPAAFLGRVAPEELPLLYGRHRVTVLPSVNSQEAFGIALLESMSTGTPVVASDLPGVREVASVGGTTAPAGDAAALADAVVDAYEDPRAFGSPEDIRARVAERYDWPRVVAELERVYARAVAGA